MDEGGKISLLLHSFCLGLVKVLDQSWNSFLRLLWFWCSWCSPEITCTEPWLLPCLSKVTSKRTCQHPSLCDTSANALHAGVGGGQFLVTAGMSDCYMHFKSLQQICWLESKSQTLTLFIRNTRTKKLWPVTLTAAAVGQIEEIKALPHEVLYQNDYCEFTLNLPRHLRNSCPENRYSPRSKKDIKDKDKRESTSENNTPLPERRIRCSAPQQKILHLIVCRKIAPDDLQ